MRFTTSILLFISLLISFSPISAQIVKDKTSRAKERTENKVDRKVDQKIDEAVDQAFDKVSSIFKRKKKSKKTKSSQSTSQQPQDRSSQNSSSQPSQSVFGGAEVKTAGTYHFDIIMTVHTQTIKKSGKVKDNADFNWMISNQGDLFGILTSDKKQGESAIIIDSQNKVMLTIMEEEKKAMTFSIKDTEQDDDDDVEIKDNNVTINKTGRTKKILGYSCNEYTMDSDEMTGRFWLTTEIKMIDFSKMPSRMKKHRKSAWSNGGLNGMMMESTMTEKGKKGKTFKTVATKVDKSGQTYRMSDYEVMSLGGFGF